MAPCACTHRVDLREWLRASGMKGRRLVLLLEDHQLGEPQVLECINSLLAGGEVPGLWSGEELAKELAPLEALRGRDAAYQVGCTMGMGAAWGQHGGSIGATEHYQQVPGPVAPWLFSRV